MKSVQAMSRFNPDVIITLAGGTRCNRGAKICRSDGMGVAMNNVKACAAEIVYA